MEEVYYNIPIFFGGISSKREKFRQKILKVEVAFGFKQGYGYIILWAANTLFQARYNLLKLIEMAKLKGILKLEGTLDDLTFYKTQDGHLVKTKGGVSKERIANDPAFARTRENGDEFAESAKAGKVLRDSVRNMVNGVADNRVASRLVQVMSQIKNLDTASPRGERKVAIGIQTPEGQALLKNFNFNIHAVLGSVLNNVYGVNIATGEITIPDLVPVNEIAYPVGATNVSLKGAFAVVDFASGVSEVSYTNVEDLPIDATSTTVSLTPKSVPTGAGTQLFLLEVEFFQEVNGAQYSLNNGAHNALAIIEVAGLI